MHADLQIFLELPYDNGRVNVFNDISRFHFISISINLIIPQSIPDVDRRKVSLINVNSRASFIGSIPV